MFIGREDTTDRAVRLGHLADDTDKKATAAHRAHDSSSLGKIGVAHVHLREYSLRRHDAASALATGKRRSMPFVCVPDSTLAFQGNLHRIDEGDFQLIHAALREAHALVS